MVVGAGTTPTGPGLLGRHHQSQRCSSCPTDVGVWLDDSFWFSTGSLARHNLGANTETTVHLENGDEVVIVEGVAELLTDREPLQRMCDVYNRKYDWTMEPAESGVTDADGAAGPAFRVTPRKVFGWAADLATPTRWSWLQS